MILDFENQEFGISYDKLYVQGLNGWMETSLFNKGVEISSFEVDAAYFRCIYNIGNMYSV